MPANEPFVPGCIYGTGESQNWNDGVPQPASFQGMSPWWTVPTNWYCRTTDGQIFVSPTWDFTAWVFAAKIDQDGAMKFQFPYGLTQNGIPTVPMNQFVVTYPPVTYPPAPPPPVPDPLAGLDNWGFFNFGNLGGITEITFNTTSSIPGFDIEGPSTLVSLSFPNLISVDPTNIQGGFIEISSNQLLTTLTMPQFIPNNGNSYGFSGNALTAASVNGLLARFVANAAYVSGTINFNGGTNSAPTGQGLTDKATLIARGCSVNTN